MKTIVTLFLFCGLQVAAKDMQSCPKHKDQTQAQHQADVEKHGDQAMGFSKRRLTISDSSPTAGRLKSRSMTLKTLATCKRSGGISTILSPCSPMVIF